MAIFAEVGQLTSPLEGLTNAIANFFGGDKLVGGVDKAVDGDLAGGAILIGLAVAENSPGGKAKHLLPGIGKGWTKLRGSQGWRDAAGNVWKKDKKHKDHWDISDRKGNQIERLISTATRSGLTVQKTRTR